MIILGRQRRATVDLVLETMADVSGVLGLFFDAKPQGLQTSLEHTKAAVACVNLYYITLKGATRVLRLSFVHSRIDAFRTVSRCCLCAWQHPSKSNAMTRTTSQRLIDVNLAVVMDEERLSRSQSCTRTRKYAWL